MAQTFHIQMFQTFEYAKICSIYKWNQMLLINLQFVLKVAPISNVFS